MSVIHFSNGAFAWKSRFSRSSDHGFPICFCDPIRLSLWPMAQTHLVHNPVYGPLTGNTHSLWLFQQQRLIHTAPSISIVTFVLTDDFFHGLCQILILPGTVFVSEVFIEALSADTKHSGIKCDFSGNPAGLCFQSQKHQLRFLLTSDGWRRKKRWLPPKIRLPPSDVGFLSSCSLTRLRSMVISSERLIALAGVWGTFPDIQFTVSYGF